MNRYQLLLKGDMVLATLNGTKTQTRRPIKLTDEYEIKEIKPCQPLL